jgi:hypothetical protein
MQLYTLLLSFCKLVAELVAGESNAFHEPDPAAGITRRPTSEEMRAYHALHSSECYCPDHGLWHDEDQHCPGCVDDWHQMARLDFEAWVEAMEADETERLDALARDYAGRCDGWYLDLVIKAGFPEGGAL